MENFAQTTRFILSANYSSKIIDPIQSRCAVFRFKPLSKDELFVVIGRIAEREGLQLDAKAKEALYIVTEGDCRKAENILQSCTSMGKHITEDLIFSMASAAKPKEVMQILELALANQFIEARDLLLKTMLNYGLSGMDLIKLIQKSIIDFKMEGRKRVTLLAATEASYFHISDGRPACL